MANDDDILLEQRPHLRLHDDTPTRATSDHFIGDEQVKRRQDDLQAAGLTLESTSDIAISGNVFSAVGPKALELKGDPSVRVVFSNNVLTDVQSDDQRLVDSVVTDSIFPETERP